VMRGDAQAVRLAALEGGQQPLFRRHAHI
jgi:hypothetical protein